MRQLTTILLTLMLIGIIACGGDNAPATPTTPTPTPPVTPEPVASADTAEPAPTEETKSFNIQAKQFEFVPSTISVNQGDHVELTIHSTDVTHGFGLPEFGITEVLEPGTPVIVEFDADKAGTFPFRCTTFCGSGHDSMKGELIVK